MLKSLQGSCWLVVLCVKNSHTLEECPKDEVEILKKIQMRN
jgi:hypothetical protein